MPLIDLKSDLTWRGNKPPNAVPDKGTLYQETRFEQNTKTGDVSTKTRGYAQYAKIYTSPLRDITSKGSFSLTDSKYNFGVATRLTQGGEGYPFPDYNGIIYDWKPVAHTGFHFNAKYGDIAGDGKGDSGRRTGFLQATYTTNSPIDDMYKKYNLQDASFQGGNWWSQPYILRGIQIKQNKPKPQRWGFNANFDDGLIRGGILTATERTIYDTVRIGKWMTSPRGLLWVAKQVGLGLTNAPVERITGKIALTQIQPGVTSLLSVAGNAFGLHFTRHAIPFLNDVGSYGNVARAKRILDSTGKNTRLAKLREELFFNPIISQITTNGLPIPSLSTGPLGTAGVGGAQSILGLTGTPIRRYTNTRESIEDIKLVGRRTVTSLFREDKTKIRYTYQNQYVSQLATNSTSAADDKNKNNRDNINFWTTPGAATDDNPAEFSSIGNDYLKVKGKDIPQLRPVNEPNSPNPVQRTNAPIPKLNDYATVAYGRIPSRGRHNYTGTPNNFVLDNIDAVDYENLITGPVVDKEDPGFKDYATKNVQAAFGYLNYGAKNTKRNGGDGNPSDYKWQDDGSGKSDIINFQIGSTKLRAYIDSISDNFSPTIDTEQPLGSPINAVRFTTLERSVSVAFKMAVLAQTDLKLVYRKMKELQSYASYSTQAGNAFTLRTIDIIIGDLYNFEGYIESVSFDWDSEMPWEITSTIGQVPLYCNVSIDFKYIVPRDGFKLVD